MYNYTQIPNNFNNTSNNKMMPINSSNYNDRIIGGGFLGPFVLGGLTGGLVAPFFYGGGYGRPNYNNNYYYPYPPYPPSPYPPYRPF